MTILFFQNRRIMYRQMITPLMQRERNMKIRIKSLFLSKTDGRMEVLHFRIQQKYLIFIQKMKKKHLIVFLHLDTFTEIDESI